MRWEEPETYSVTLVYTSWLLMLLLKQQYNLHSSHQIPLFTGFHFLITCTAINVILFTLTVPIDSTARHSCYKYPQIDCLY